MSEDVIASEDQGRAFIKYGKSYADLLNFKEELMVDNSRWLERNRKVIELYKKQPIRTHCKICNSELQRWKFHSHGVGYFCCGTCGHINGEYMDTEEFTKALYESDVIGYGDEYQDLDFREFDSRTRVIYLPKAEFMKAAIDRVADSQRMKYVDIGAGAGHYVAAMRKLSLDAVGVEVDRHQVEYASRILSHDAMVYCPASDICQYIHTVNADCISFIYCLEHMSNLIDVFEAINSNEHIRFIYFSVPMFSLSAILESANDEVFPRVLGAEHTHIFTNESIQYLCKKFSLHSIGEWRFGADIADLLRTAMVKLKISKNLELMEILNNHMTKVMDDLQYVLDRNGFCSDIHIVLRK